MAKWVTTNFGNPITIDKFTQTLASLQLGHMLINHGDIFRGDYPYDKKDSEVMYFGSIRGCQVVFRDTQWPCWFDDSVMSCHNYYSHWGDLMINRNYAFLTLAEILRRKDNLFKHFGARASGMNRQCIPISNGAIFIRPNSNNKPFTGQIVFTHEWQAFETEMGAADFNVVPTTLCLVAEPVRIYEEYRCLIRRGEYITGSKYYQNGQTEYGPVPDEVVAYANSVPSFDGLPNLYMLDIGRTDAGFGIVEIGSVHCAGLYEMDQVKFITAVSQEVDLWASSLDKLQD